MDEPVGHGHDARSARVRSRQSGFTLIETLVALALLGIAFFGIAYGLLTTMTASSANDGRVSANTALIAVTERMKGQTYVACATPAVVKQQLVTAWTGSPSGSMVLSDGRAVTASVTKVEYWNSAGATGATSTTVAPRFQTTCPPGGDAGSQLVSLVVKVGETSVKGQVVLRNRADLP